MAETLLVGQVDDAAAPSAAAAKLYQRSLSYGSSAGNDVLLLVETPNRAPAGPLGRVVGRLISVPITYDNACSIRVTPIIDENTELAPTIKSFAAPSTRMVGRVELGFFKVLTLIRTRVEVLTRNGPVDVHTAQLGGTVIAGARPNAAGATR